MQTYNGNAATITTFFRQHLTELYSFAITFETAGNLFTQLSLSTIPRPFLQTLDVLITNKEVIEATKTLKLHKRLGPEGFSASYYKCFLDILAHLFEQAYNDLQDKYDFAQNRR